MDTLWHQDLILPQNPEKAGRNREAETRHYKFLTLRTSEHSNMVVVVPHWVFLSFVMQQ